MRLAITGGCGFIGSAACRRAVDAQGWSVLNIDALAYAGRRENVAMLEGRPSYAFLHADIADRARIADALAAFQPDAILHLAAETHVDRSIDAADAFVQTNIVGAHALLEAARAVWRAMTPDRRARFRFVHVSTDEVFGALGPEGRFTEASPYRPRSPYAASKAASDHLARAWRETYGLPVIVSNCTNNYGPYQFPEKLIPLSILNALEGKPIAIYGDGGHSRDWLHVDDHVAGLFAILECGAVGETYLFGGGDERTSLQVAHAICAILDAEKPSRAPHADLITPAPDRPGHDRRYAADSAKARAALDWAPQRRFEDGLRETVRWYIANEAWWGPIREGLYAGRRLGAGAAQT
jgi:dTDP-glucose 4,6-dehydratase